MDDFLKIITFVSYSRKNNNLRGHDNHLPKGPLAKNHKEIEIIDSYCIIIIVTCSHRHPVIPT